MYPHTSPAHELFRAPLVVALIALMVGVGDARASEPDASDWSKGQKSAGRLISAGGLVGDHYRAGVEIKLDPGSLTYWRSPGDAGVPPVFSFADSDNLVAATVQYPAPSRYEEGGVEVFGYRGTVIFPLDIAPKDKSKPVNLVLSLQYAACDKICIPAEAKAQLRLLPAAATSPFAAQIESFAALTPKPANKPGAPAIRLAKSGQAGANWDVSMSPAPNVAADLFAEAPEGWYFDTKREADHFSLILSQRPAEAKEREIEVVLTYTSAAGAFELKQRLDAGPATP